MKDKVIELTEGYRGEANQIIIDNWLSTKVIIRKEIIDTKTLPGFITLDDNNKITGLITYKFYDNICEITTLNSLVENQGIGSALVNKVKEVAASHGCTGLRLITTNDNIRALQFYQKRAFVITAINLNAMEYVRKYKDIPLIGDNNIPLRDEIQFECEL